MNKIILVIFALVFSILGCSPQGQTSPQNNGKPPKAKGSEGVGGGELLKDSQNPWFVQNTSQVSYCIKIDTNNFHQSPSIIKSQIKNALSYWKEEFDHAYIPPNYNGQHPVRYVSVGQQEFVEVDCSKDTDVTFQFGILAPEQLSQFKDVSRTIGAAIRTEYDRVNLRGRGYIYLAADSGPLKFSGRNLVSEPWSMGNGHLIFLVLLHELGHVFGIPHLGNEQSLMAENFAESLFNYETAKFYSDFQAVPGGLFTSDISGEFVVQIGIDFKGSNIRKFFSIPEEKSIVQYQFEKGSLKVFASKGDATSKILIGETTFDPSAASIQHRRLIRLWLPDEQKVFLNDDYGSEHPEGILDGPMVTVQTFNGNYKPIVGPERKIAVTFDGGGITQMFGVLDDTFVFNLLGPTQ